MLSGVGVAILDRQHRVFLGGVVELALATQSSLFVDEQRSQIFDSGSQLVGGQRHSGASINVQVRSGKRSCYEHEARELGSRRANSLFATGGPPRASRTPSYNWRGFLSAEVMRLRSDFNARPSLVVRCGHRR